MKELILKKCLKCNALVKVIEDCDCKDCGIMCCGEKMHIIKANSVDASFEKHIPTYKVEGNNIIINVNHVMEEDHYIEWIMVLGDKIEIKKEFNPGDILKVTIPKQNNIKIYSYCNKHGLWINEIK